MTLFARDYGKRNLHNAVLKTLGEYRGSFVSTGELADDLVATNEQLLPVLNDLYSKGLVERRKKGMKSPSNSFYYLWRVV